MNTKTSQSVITVKDLFKKFTIPHERTYTLKGAFVNFFRKNIFENFYALKNVSFEVKKGEFFGILGRNGSGKSTLLKILAGVYTADSGSVNIDGLVSPFLELGIGFNPELSGRDNIYLNATVLGLCQKDIDEKFDSIVAFSELERFIDQKIKNYSSGMQVRLAFSVAIHANREILLMDEVLAVGDANFQAKCLREFARYKEMGKTVILVTHDIATVQRYCDRAMLLRNGEVVKIGSAEEVGNEYIYENMSDEEKRIILRKNKIITIDSKKNITDAKIAEITDVVFLDKKGQSKNTFETGEHLDIKVSYKLINNIDELNIGVGLHAINGGQIFGYNTQMDNIKLDHSTGNVIMHFDSFPLLKGEYFLNVACWGKIEQNPYDYRHNYKQLMMFSDGIKNTYRGFYDIKHEWIM